MGASPNYQVGSGYRNAGGGSERFSSLLGAVPKFRF